MKRKHKAYLRLNIMSLFFAVVSFISVTLAWFAYSGLTNVSTEIGVKAWYIELEKNGQTVSNDIIISLSEIYPGMETVSETVNIKNLGDSDAEVSYKIISARILGDEKDNYIANDTTTKSEYIEDVLAHNYPFHININLNKGYTLAKGDENSFQVSISWPLDSDSNELDSIWGTEAYKFQLNEENKKSVDPDYQIRPSIQIVISVTAEQYLGTETSSDIRYDLGDEIWFDVQRNKLCYELSSTCIKTHIIDVNNKLGDETVTLLPDPNNIHLSSTYSDYNLTFETITKDWVVNTRPLLVQDVLKVITTDVMDSLLVRDGISDMIIGNLKYDNRMNTEIARAVSYNGYYKFVNEKFKFLSASDCYWANSEYDSENGFAIKKIDESHSKIYGELKSSTCNVIPVILVSKEKL